MTYKICIRYVDLFLAQVYAVKIGDIFATTWTYATNAPICLYKYCIEIDGICSQPGGLTYRNRRIVPDLYNLEV